MTMIEWDRIKLEIGTVDFTGFLANTDQTATLPYGPEVGRAVFALLDNLDSPIPTIGEWDVVRFSAGTAVGSLVPVWAGYVTRLTREPLSSHGGSRSTVTLDCSSGVVRLSTSEPVTIQYGLGSGTAGTGKGTAIDSSIAWDLGHEYLLDIFNASKVSYAGSVNLEYVSFVDENVRSCLNKLGERVVKEWGVDASLEFYYRPESTVAAYGYGLSDTPNFSTTFPMSTRPVDDKDSIDLRNSVRVLGGWTYSDTQVESDTGDGSTKNFLVAHRPEIVISVTMGGLSQSVGVDYVDDPADFDVLVNFDEKTFKFGVAPSSGKPVVFSYRYPYRIDVTVQDAASVSSIGFELWAPTIEDASISSSAQGTAVGSAYLASVVTPIHRAEVSTRCGGLSGTVLPWEPGGRVALTSSLLGWSSTDLTIRSVTVRALPRPDTVAGGAFVFWDLAVGEDPVTLGFELGRGYSNEGVTPLDAIPSTGHDIKPVHHGSLVGNSDDDHPQYVLKALAGGSATYTTSNVSTDRSFNANSTTLDEIADVLGTLIHDLQVASLLL